MIKRFLNCINPFYLKPEDRVSETAYRGYQIMQGTAFTAVILASLICLLCSGCCSYLVEVRERNVASYDVGKAIERGIQRVECTGHFVSDIEIKKGSLRISNGEDTVSEWKKTYDIIVYGDVWEKRLTYFYWRTAPNYESVKDILKKRMKDAKVWTDQ